MTIATAPRRAVLLSLQRGPAFIQPGAQTGLDNDYAHGPAREIVVERSHTGWLHWLALVVVSNIIRLNSLTYGPFLYIMVNMVYMPICFEV
jgi:hypothetical protein